MDDLREEDVVLDGLHLSFLLPASPDELIDDSEFNVDERLPYWAELWPSARALAGYLHREAPPSGRALELGSGVGLPSLVLKARGWEVTATDYYESALDFVTLNAQRNGIEPPELRMVDWRDPPADLGRWSLLVAADVLYESRNIHSLAGVLQAIIEPGGRLVLSDPGRTYLQPFVELMQSARWTAELLETRQVESTALGVKPSQVQIWSLVAPGDQ